MERIQEMGPKIKYLLDQYVGEWGFVAMIFLVAFASFGLGRLSMIEHVTSPVSIGEAPKLTEPRGMYPGGLVVASDSGNSYYLSWCTGAQKITSQHQVWFESDAAARKAGYQPAKNCKGLQ